MDTFGKNCLADTPCIGICSTAIGDEICIGCGRTFHEVNHWNTMKEEDRIRVNQRLLADA